MPWFHGIAERNHFIQSPTSEDKIRLLGERLQLDPSSTVLDIGSGRGGPALVLAREFGCRLTCIEWFDEFVAVARQRALAAGVDELIDVVQADATTYEIEPDRYDAALCIGASFVFGGFDRTLTVLGAAVRTGGHVAVGELYWETPPPKGKGAPSPARASFAETFAKLDARFPVVSIISASEDDWDDYSTLRLLTVEDWLAENAADPDAPAIRAEHEASKDFYARTRGKLGWAIFAGRKTR